MRCNGSDTFAKRQDNGALTRNLITSKTTRLAVLASRYRVVESKRVWGRIHESRADISKQYRVCHTFVNKAHSPEIEPRWRPTCNTVPSHNNLRCALFFRVHQYVSKCFKKEKFDALAEVFFHGSYVSVAPAKGYFRPCDLKYTIRKALLVIFTCLARFQQAQTQHVPELRNRVMRKGSLHPASASTQYLNIVRSSVDFFNPGATFNVTFSPVGKF